MSFRQHLTTPFPFSSTTSFTVVLLLTHYNVELSLSLLPLALSLNSSMAATSLTPSVSTPSPSSASSCKAKTLGFKLGFVSSSSPSLKPLIYRVSTSNASTGRSSLSARMVSAPSMTPTTSLNFNTSVFKKEKVSLAGHDEVDLFRALKPLFG